MHAYAGSTHTHAYTHAHTMHMHVHNTNVPNTTPTTTLYFDSKRYDSSDAQLDQQVKILQIQKELERAEKMYDKIKAKNSNNWIFLVNL